MDKLIFIIGYFGEFKYIITIIKKEEELSFIRYIDHLFHALLFKIQIVLFYFSLVNINITNELTIFTKYHWNTLYYYHYSTSVFNES